MKGDQGDYVVGTCTSMCPASEIALRKSNKLVHFYENSVLIKEFSRSAADKKNAKPCDLRTLGALYNTIDYLFNKWVLEYLSSPPWQWNISSEFSLAIGAQTQSSTELSRRQLSHRPLLSTLSLGWASSSALDKWSLRFSCENKRKKSAET